MTTNSQAVDVEFQGLIDAQLQIGGNVHLADAYMENLVEVHGVRLKTCWDLPQRTKNMYKALTKNVTIEAESREKCTHETSKEDSEREEKSKSLPWNQSEIQSLKPCFAENDARLQTLLRRQSNLRDAIAKGSFTNVTLTLCEHFYGYLKMHDDQTGRAISFLQQLKKITGCLDIVNVSKIRTGNTSMSYFDELDLTNLTEIDYDEALCGNFFALRIMRNMFLQRIDINENLILKGAYFIRKNAEKVEVYSGGKLNSTFQWNNPEDCLQDDPTHLLLICKTIIGSVYGESLPPALRSRMFTKEVKRIHGQLIITSTSAVDLSDYQHLTIIAHNKNAVIVNNTKVLRNIGALTKMTITLPEMFPKDTLKEWKPFVLRNNGKLCDKLRYEKILREKVSTPIEFSEGCKIKKRCVGGIVTDIMSLQGCWIIMGGLTIKDYEFESSSHLLRYFEEIEEVEGQLIIMNNTGIKNLAFLKSLLRVSDYTTKRPIFRVADNPNLTSIEPLHKVELEYSPYEVHLVAVIETYSKISDHEQKELGIQGKVEFRVKERCASLRLSVYSDTSTGSSPVRDGGIALSVGGCLIITIFGYGYSFFAYLREQRELKRRQQPGGGQAAPVERAP
nr:EGF receptor domain containing protein [Haemonchus contortus]